MRSSRSRVDVVQEGGRWAVGPTSDEAIYLPETATRHQMKLRCPAWNEVRKRLDGLQCRAKNVKCASRNSWS